ncbi:MAG: ribonuclease Y [Chloroflexi bacterium]|nr:ribonuclease Y [Chloroflexota bacterium]
MSQGLLILLVSVIALGLGGGVTYLVLRFMASKKVSAAEEQAERLVTEAKTKSKEMLLEAKEEAIKVRAASETELRERRSELQRMERRLSQKEENLERKTDAMERREHQISIRDRESEAVRGSLEEFKQKQLQRLELISGMSSSEAREYLLQEMEKEVRDEGTRRVREMEKWSREQAVEKAREIVAQAIQRCATDVVSETTVSVVPLPNDEMKGRLIGREGRNIRALESATGVDLIIDDTPEAVTVSSFDPVRREVARLTLSKLILDGRIHPARIEEVVAKTKSEVEATIRSEGERAAYETGVPGLHPELIKLLGRLKYRFSYGQNVLLHSIETAHLAGMIAAELGTNVEVAKKAGLLHDIGKAVDHEVKGPHALIGADLVKQWDKSQEVVRAVAEHHGEASTTSIEGFIVSAADAISGSRPGARREALEQYLKRLETLEAIANSFEGVEKSYAIQAGREIRIMVKPESIDDLGAMRLARDIVQKVEETMQYPGQIKVTVIRETRAVDYAR